MPIVNHAGFECPVIFDGVDYNAVKWDGTETTQEIDVTTTANYDSASDRCYNDFIRGTTMFEGTVTFIFDSNLKPYPQLRDGAYVNLMELQCDLTGSKIAMKAFIRSLKLAPTDINGRVECEISFRNKGLITYT